MAFSIQFLVVISNDWWYGNFCYHFVFLEIIIFIILCTYIFRICSICATHAINGQTMYRKLRSDACTQHCVKWNEWLPTQNRKKNRHKHVRCQLIMMMGDDDDAVDVMSSHCMHARTHTHAHTLIVDHHCDVYNAIRVHLSAKRDASTLHATLMSAV